MPRAGVARRKSRLTVPGNVLSAGTFLRAMGGTALMRIGGLITNERCVMKSSGRVSARRIAVIQLEHAPLRPAAARYKSFSFDPGTAVPGYRL